MSPTPSPSVSVWNAYVGSHRSHIRHKKDGPWIFLLNILFLISFVVLQGPDLVSSLDLGRASRWCQHSTMTVWWLRACASSASKQFPQTCSPLPSFGLRSASSPEGDACNTL